MARTSVCMSRSIMIMFKFVCSSSTHTRCCSTFAACTRTRTRSVNASSLSPTHITSHASRSICLIDRSISQSIDRLLFWCLQHALGAIRSFLFPSFLSSLPQVRTFFCLICLLLSPLGLDLDPASLLLLCVFSILIALITHLYARGGCITSSIAIVRRTYVSLITHQLFLKVVRLLVSLRLVEKGCGCAEQRQHRADGRGPRRRGGGRAVRGRRLPTDLHLLRVATGLVARTGTAVC